MREPIVQPKTAARIDRRGIEKAVSRRITAGFLAIFLFALAISSFYFLALGLETQQRGRIQHLVESGLSVDGSVKFDERFSDQSFRWPWQENKPFKGDEVRFAEMWLKSHVIAELLLDYYYCDSSSYYCLVWLLGNLKKDVSYWENAVNLAVHGDANKDGVSNYDCLLGPNADVLNTFSPNPVTTYALERNLSKEAILQLKSFETDGRMDEWEKEVIDLILNRKIPEDRTEWIVKNLDPNPATIYALRQQLPNDQVKLVEPFGKDDHLAEWERYIIDNLEVLPSLYVDWAIEKAMERRSLTDWERYFVDCIGRLPDFFTEQVVDDGSVSYKEWMQAQFLERFSSEYLEDKGAQWICNPDLDGDGFTNEFENGVSYTDPYVCNERYAIFLCSDDLPVIWRNEIRAVEEFLTPKSNSPDRDIWTLASKPYLGFKGENIHTLYGENMTFQNFKRVIREVAERSDEHDTVFLLFAGHGEKNHISLSDKDVSYEEINHELVRLQAKVVCCIIDACYSGSAIPHLQSQDRVMMTSSGEAEKTYGGTLCYSFFNATQNKSNDQDGDGYCSVLESFYGAKMSLEHKSGNHPQLSNETLAGVTYLLELYLNEHES